MKRNLWLSILSIVTVLGITVAINNYRYKDNGAVLRSMSELEGLYIDKDEIDYEIFNEGLRVSDMKSVRGKYLTDRDYFILGYNSYINNDVDKAIFALKTINDNLTSSTDSFIKVYSGKILVELLLSLERYNEAYVAIDNMINNMSVRELNKCIEIYGIIDSIIYLPYGRKYSIDIYEKIVEQDIDNYTSANLKNRLSVLYILNGNYARAIEKCMEVIAISSGGESPYHEAKAKADMGITYSLLGNYAEAERLFNEALNIEIENKANNAYLKVYTLANLYEMMLTVNEYDNIVSINEQIQKYTEDLPEGIDQQILKASSLSFANYFTEKGDIAEAERYIEESLKIKTEEKTAFFIDTETFYYFSLGNLMAAKGNVNAAEENYMKALENSRENVNYSNIKDVLKLLIELYDEHGYYDKVMKYSGYLEEVYEKESSSINQDYAEYALYKYDYETQLLEIEKRRVQRHIILFSIISAALVCTIVIYMKYTNLIRKSRNDVLTQCYNRRYFDECYKELVNKNNKFSIIIMDIDNFKLINDTYGHVIGDEVLKKVVDTIKILVGPKNKLFRYGGEELVVLTKENSIDEIIYLCEDIRKSIENILWDNNLNVTISIGAAMSRNNYRDILEEADKNLYVSKATGKNKVTIKGYKKWEGAAT